MHDTNDSYTLGSIGYNRPAHGYEFGSPAWRGDQLRQYGETQKRIHNDYMAHAAATGGYRSVGGGSLEISGRAVKICIALIASPFACWFVVSAGQFAYQDLKAHNAAVLQQKENEAVDEQVSLNFLNKGFKNRGASTEKQTSDVAYIRADPLSMDAMDGTHVVINHVCGTQVHVVMNYYKTHLSQIIGYDDIHAYVPTQSLSARQPKICLDQKYFNVPQPNYWHGLFGRLWAPEFNYAKKMVTQPVSAPVNPGISAPQNYTAPEYISAYLKVNHVFLKNMDGSGFKAKGACGIHVSLANNYGKRWTEIIGDNGIHRYVLTHTLSPTPPQRCLPR